MAFSNQSSERDVTIEQTNCYTEFNTKIVSFLWTIKDFFYCPQKTGEFLTSSVFPTNTEFKSKWVLNIYPQGDVYDNRGFVSVFLKLEDCIDNIVFAEFKVAVIDTKGRKANVTPVEQAGTFQPGTAWGIDRFIERRTLVVQKIDLLSDGNFTIYCEVSITDIVNTPGRTKCLLPKVPKCDLFENIGSLFDNPEFSDVTLIVGGKKIFAHKAILSACSPVFSAMFRYGMKENSENSVDIKDVPYEIMKEVLRFIYFGKVSNLKTSAHIFLSLANRYCLEQMKAIAEEEIASNISIERAADALILADMHNANKLKSCVLDFITANCVSVRNTEGWKSLTHRAPHLIDEAYFELTKRMNALAVDNKQIDKEHLNNKQYSLGPQ